jgi:archaellum biogenesis ATPase FlaH
LVHLASPSKGFTILATLNPSMHNTEEAHAIMDVFDGHMDVHETVVANRPKKVLRIKRLLRQRYRDEEITLSK